MKKLIKVLMILMVIVGIVGNAYSISDIDDSNSETEESPVVISFEKMVQSFIDFRRAILPDYPQLLSSTASDLDQVPLEIRGSERGQLLNQLRVYYYLIVGDMQSGINETSLVNICKQLESARQMLVESKVVLMPAENAAKEKLIENVLSFSDHLECAELQAQELAPESLQQLNTCIE